MLAQAFERNPHIVRLSEQFRECGAEPRPHINQQVRDDLDITWRVITHSIFPFPHAWHRIGLSRSFTQRNAHTGRNRPNVTDVTRQPIGGPTETTRS